MEKQGIAARLNVTMLGTLTALLIAAFATLALWQAFHNALARAEQRTQALAQIFADFAYRALDTYDQILVDVQGEMAAGESPNRLTGYLRTQKGHHANLLNLFVFDANGAVVAGTQQGAADLADRSYFTVHRDDADVGRHIGKPDVSRITGRWFFPISRRVEAPGGELLGVVAATVDLADLTHSFEALREDDWVAIALLHHDGTLMVRTPAVADSVGKVFPMDSFHGSRSRTLHNRSPLDGKLRIVTQQQVSRYPLVVLASVPMDMVMEEWRNSGIIIAVVAVVMIAAVLAFTLHLRREASARDRLLRQLAGAKEQAEQALHDLSCAQDMMVRNEKLAALGGLVAGVAHEINTPVGNALTSASFLAKETAHLAQAFADKTLTASVMKDYLEAADEAARLTLSNCERAAELIHGFKQVAVDQTSGERRSFDLAEYVSEILLSLRPKFKHTHHRIDTYIPEGVVVDGYPGALSQVITNLVVNSLMHGFDDGRAGVIDLAARVDGDMLELVYSDNGKGIPEEQVDEVFHPFFTTKRGSGGSGLGLNIVHNIVHRTLAGTLELDSRDGRGVHFTIRFPLKAPAPAGASQGQTA